MSWKNGVWRSRTERAIPSATVRWGLALSLAVLSIALYSNALSNGFVYDDEDQVLNNPWIRDPRFLPEIFTSGAWAYTGQDVNYYRPVMHVFYMAGYHLFGLDPVGFHLLNILLHAGVSILVFLLFSTLFLDDRDSADGRGFDIRPYIGALVFVTHPIHTEAVTWIGGVPDLSFTFFCLLSFYLYIRLPLETLPSWRISYLLSLASFFTATLCKETALVLPLFLVAHDRLFRREPKRFFVGVMRYLPYALILTVYLLLRFYALGGVVPVQKFRELSSYQQAINIFPLLAKYLGKLLIPVDLKVFYVFHPISSIFEARGIVSLLVLATLVLMTTLFYKKHKTACFGLLAVLIPLIPVLYIPALGENPFAERYLYLPSVGFAMFFPLIPGIYRRAKPKSVMPLVIAFALLIGAYSYGVVKRNPVWKNEYSLWEDAVKKSPDGPIPNYNFGLILLGRGEVDEAIKYFNVALKIKPSARVYSDLALAYGSKGQGEEAIRLLQTAIRLDPNYPLAYNNLGVAFTKKGRFLESIELYRIAILLNPNYVDAYINMGYSLDCLGRKEEATESYRIALTISPSDERALRRMNLLMN